MQTFTKSIIVILSLFFSLNTLAQITYEPAFPNIDFAFPVEIQSPQDGTDRMFIVEQPGSIKVFPRDSNVTPSEVSTFLNIEGQVSYSTGQERGLLGLAFHPSFSSNGYFYVYYTTNSPVSGISTRMVLSRFTVDSNNTNLADPNSELNIFQFDKNQNNSNHNGGKIAFGPDGYLYISFGDGGGGNDPQGNGQNINTVFGSICRIDVDIDGNNPIETNPILPDGNYEIPSNNPLVGQTGLDEIYAYGIRNTWKFSFDNPTGRLWGADVGQNAFEEINLIDIGENYGWSRFEATSVANSSVTITEPTTFPVFFYDRSQGDISITGGYVYRGSDIASIDSKYIFGDYVSGRVWSLDYNEATGDASSSLLFKTNGEFVSSFGVDIDGELYFSDYGSNAQLYRITDGDTMQEAIAVNGFGNWQSQQQGVINGEVNAIAAFSGGNVAYGGTFNQAGILSVNNIALWNDDTGWSTIGGGTNGAINALEIDSDGNLYAGGAFTEIDGVSANNIAVWNGSNWAALDSGVNGPVLSLEIDSNNNLYVGGVFETIGGTDARNIGLWNGNQWSTLTDATNAIHGTNNEIRSLYIDINGMLYVGGNFDEAGGNNANRIATWNGSNWGTLGIGTSGFVQAIVSTTTDVFVGGNFAIAGGQTVNRISKWNKSTNMWSMIGEGVNNNVNVLTHDGTFLFAAGVFDVSFDTNNNYIVNNIARWRESDGWQALGTNTQVGVNTKINAMVFAQDTDGIDKLYVGGNFSSAGAINANNAAIWFSENYVPDEENPEEEPFKYYPNPTNGILTLTEVVNWTVSNNLGQIISIGISSSIDFSTYSAGLYVLRIENRPSIKIIKN